MADVAHRSTRLQQHRRITLPPRLPLRFALPWLRIAILANDDSNRVRDIPTYATLRCQSISMSVRPARMTSSFSRPLNPETMDQVTVCSDALPRWGTSSSERRRRPIRSRCFCSSPRGVLRSGTKMRPGGIGDQARAAPSILQAEYTSSQPRTLRSELTYWRNRPGKEPPAAMSRGMTATNRSQAS